MGRYALFSTGVEYKCGIAAQASSDMRMFGGVITTDATDLKLGKYSHRWDNDKDAKEILKILYDYVSDTDVIVPDFTSFQLNFKGTYNLYDWLYTHPHTYYDWLSSNSETFTLGCLIYHQLLYDHTLTVGYEV